MYYTTRFDYLNVSVTKMAVYHITQNPKKNAYCCLHLEVAKNFVKKTFINTNF